MSSSSVGIKVKLDLQNEWKVPHSLSLNNPCSISILSLLSVCWNLQVNRICLDIPVRAFLTTDFIRVCLVGVF